MKLLRRHPVSATLCCISLPIWAAFAIAGLEAVLVVVLVQTLIVVAKGLWS